MYYYATRYGIPRVILPSPDVGIQNVSGIKNDRRTLGMMRAYT